MTNKNIFINTGGLIGYTIFIIVLTSVCWFVGLSFFSSESKLIYQDRRNEILQMDDSDIVAEFAPSLRAVIAEYASNEAESFFGEFFNELEKEISNSIRREISRSAGTWGIGSDSATTATD